MYCAVTTAPGGTNHWVFDFQINGVNQFFCEIFGAATTCNLTGDSTAFSAGDLLDIESFPTAPASAAASCGVGVGP